MAAAALLGLAAIGGAGCSPVLASRQPSRRDVGLLSPGVPRNMLLAELGQPVATETKDGRRVEVFSFVQGYRKGVKVARTIGHGAADVMTLGLWEVVGTPTEATLNGHRVAHEVTYDTSVRIDRVVLLKQQALTTYNAELAELADNPCVCRFSGFRVDRRATFRRRRR
jgi:hypothetical protein